MAINAGSGLRHYHIGDRVFDKDVKWLVVHEETGEVDHLERVDGTWVALSKFTQADQRWLEKLAKDCLEYDRKWLDTEEQGRMERSRF